MEEVSKFGCWREGKEKEEKMKKKMRGDGGAATKKREDEMTTICHQPNPLLLHFLLTLVPLFTPPRRLGRLVLPVYVAPIYPRQPSSAVPVSCEKEMMSYLRG